MKILITCFEPFGGEAINPGAEAVGLLPDKIGGAAIIKARLPVVFGESINALYAALDADLPDAVICIGQAGGRASIAIERVAINIDDAKSPDNAGNTPTDATIFADGPAAYFATLPIKAIVADLRGAGIPAAISDSAGTYVCNHIMYAALHYAADKPGLAAGFVHIPYLPCQAAEKPNAPSMSLETVVAGLEIIVKAVSRGC